MPIPLRKVLPLTLFALLVAANVHAQIQTYTNRADWEAAVAAAASTAEYFNFTGLTLGRVSQLDTNYADRFRIVVDHVSASTFSNPGIDIFPDASCSLGSGDCNVFTFNMKDPTSTLDMPTTNALVFPQPILAFGGDFIQTGIAPVPTPTVTGPVTLHFGAESIVVNDFVDASGNGFFGFVATTPSDTLSFTFVKSGTIQNDIFQIYNPAFGAATAADPAEEMSDEIDLIESFGLARGTENGLVVKLNAAIVFLDQGNVAGACGKLNDLIVVVNSQKGKKLTVAQANQLLAETNAIKNLLGCQ